MAIYADSILKGSIGDSAKSGGGEISSIVIVGGTNVIADNAISQDEGINMIKNDSTELTTSHQEPKFYHTKIEYAIDVIHQAIETHNVKLIWEKL